MGVPGFVIWIAFLGTLLTRLWLRYRAWKRAGDDLQAGLCMFTLTYLVAATVNATFDVYLEGPMGGIWFWSGVGLGLSLIAWPPPAPRRPRSLPHRTEPAVAVGR
jgi:O-antigen ligase